MATLPCGCESSSEPPYIRFCARHEPARVEALERLCHDILGRVKAIEDKADGPVGTFLPRIAQISAADAMEDLLDEFLTRYKELTPGGSPLPSAEKAQPAERRPKP